MSTKRKTVFIILLILTAATLSFIFVNSCLPGEISTEESNSVYSGILKPLLAPLEGIFGEFLDEYNARKIAHVLEYFLLAVEFNLLAVTLKKYDIKRVGIILLFGVLVALFDETLQIFSGRGPMIEDVWIDFIGVFLATAIIYLIVLIIRAIKNKKNKKA